MCSIRLFWIVFLLVFIKSQQINANLLKCQKAYNNPILNCSDAADASGENLHDDCFPSYSILTLHLENTRELDQSSFQDCTTAMVLKIINGSLETVHPETFRNWNHLKNIDLEGNRIQTLENGSFLIEQQYYANFFSINISRNSLERVEDGAFRVLELKHSALSLNLSHNKLSSFNMSAIDVKVVNQLDLSFNSIQEFQGHGPSLVDKLDLSYNSLKDLSKLHFPSQDYLERLSLSHNDIENIPLKTFSKMDHLQDLDLSFNKLHTLRFGVFNNLTRLNALDLSNNHLISKSLDTVHSLTYLRHLYFHNNHVERLDLKDFTRLFSVSFFGNKIHFNCQQLARELKNLHNTRVVNGPDLDVENVHGIACSSDGNSETAEVDFIKLFKNFTSQNKDLIKAIEDVNDLRYADSKSRNDNLESHLEKYERILEESLGKLKNEKSGQDPKKDQLAYPENGLKARLTLISVQLAILILFIVILVGFGLWKNNFRFCKLRRGGSIPYRSTGGFMSPSIQELNDI